MSIEIELEGGRVEYEPGGLLEGRVTLTPAPGEEGRKVELSVLWQTEGKGNTDLGVLLHRVIAEDGIGAREAHAFEARLRAAGFTQTICWGDEPGGFAVFCAAA